MSTKARVRIPYEVGILARGMLADLTADAQSVGLTVTDHPGGGWLVKRGWLVVEGERAAMIRWYEAWKEATR